jgi:hypothetical protein
LLRDESLEESDNPPDPDVLAQEIVVPRLAPLGTTPSQGTRHAVASVEGSKTTKPPVVPLASPPSVKETINNYNLAFPFRTQTRRKRK